MNIKIRSYILEKVSQINETAVLNLIKLSKNNKEKKKYENFTYLYLKK